MQLAMQYYCLIAKPKSISLIDWLFTNWQVCVVSSLLTFDISFLILIYVNWQIWYFGISKSKSSGDWVVFVWVLDSSTGDYYFVNSKTNETKRNELEETKWTIKSSDVSLLFGSSINQSNSAKSDLVAKSLNSDSAATSRHLGQSTD